MNEKIVVAMSGGVDSSVVAALLKKQGHDVIGMTLNLWKDDQQQKGVSITESDSVLQARIVAEQLQIPFHVLDVKEEFKKCVVDQFVNDYLNGMTPNPCFLCNQTIKWGIMLDKAIMLGAVHLATGHYARIQKDDLGNFHLLKASDTHKDQSYVLAGLTQNQLSYALLPLERLTKNEVRVIAKELGLKAAETPESQDLCFIKEGGYRAFLDRQNINKLKPGKILTSTGEEVGQHLGLENYTIGQRKGIGSGYKVPQYVIRKNIEENELIIGPIDELGTNIIHARSVNMISKDHLDRTGDYSVKIRYKATPVACKVDEGDNHSIKITLPILVRDATPGQIAVIYNQDEVIASGVIFSTERV